MMKTINIDGIKTFLSLCLYHVCTCGYKKDHVQTLTTNLLAVRLNLQSTGWRRICCLKRRRKHHDDDNHYYQGLNNHYQLIAITAFTWTVSYFSDKAVCYSNIEQMFFFSRLLNLWLNHLSYQTIIHFWIASLSCPQPRKMNCFSLDMVTWQSTTTTLITLPRGTTQTAVL